MRFSTSLLGLSAWSLLAASSFAAEGEKMACGSEPSADFLAIADQMRLDEIENAFDKTEAEGPIQVDVYYHALAADQQEMDGITDKDIQQQTSVLNDIYGRYNIHFTQKGVSREVNLLTSSTLGFPSELVTRENRQGGYNALNVYLMTSLGQFPQGTILGYGQFPKDVKPESSDFYNDGVAIVSSSIPNGSLKDYNSGKNLVHETGHWLGLFHTFQDGCDGQGDQVDDTPAQAEASEGDCNAKQDTCPNKPGNDPIHNFMDYSAEECKYEFTPGQITRANGMWKKFRAGKDAAWAGEDGTSS